MIRPYRRISLADLRVLGCKQAHSTAQRGYYNFAIRAFIVGGRTYGFELSSLIAVAAWTQPAKENVVL